MQAQDFAQEGMVDFVASEDVLGFGVFEDVAGQEAAIDGDVDVLVDGGRDDEAAAVVPIPGGACFSTSACAVSTTSFEVRP